MLFQELGKMKRSWIMTALIMIAVGVVMILCPVDYMGMLITVLGYILLILATVIVLNFLSSKKVLINYVALTGGLAVGLIGFFVLVQRREILPMLSLLFGLILVVTGLYDLFNAFMYTRRAGRTAWWILALLSLLTIAFGAILLINPWWETTAQLKLVIGVMMLYSSV